MAKRGDLKWGTVENLQRLIDEYFRTCELRDVAPNQADFCNVVQISKETFNYYANGRYEARLSVEAREAKQQAIEEYGKTKVMEIEQENGIYEIAMPWQRTNEIDSIKADVSVVLKTAKQRLEGWAWRKGYELRNPAMAIFTLKAVHGYTDQPQEINLSQNNLQLNIKIEQSPLKQPVITVTED